MMKNRFSISLACLTCIPLFSSVYLSTTVNPVLVPSYAELAGPIKWIVNYNDFSNASEEPVFIRIRLASDVTLAQTLVDIESETTLHEPISLALYMDSEEGTTLAAPSDTFQIIRWRKGENVIWLKVKHSAETWLNRNGQPDHPTELEPVYILMGISRQDSQNLLSPYFETQRANLPFNSGPQGNPKHTLLFVNTQESNLGTGTREEPILRFDIIPFVDSENVTTSLNPRHINNGNSIAVYFTGEDDIGFAIQRDEVRIIPHITPRDSLFKTQISILNMDSGPQAITLLAFDNEGTQTGVFTEFLEPKERIVRFTNDYFYGYNVAYCEIVNLKECKVSVAYMPLSGEGSPALVHEKNILVDEFILYPNHNPRFFDGLAAVNMGSLWTEMFFTAYDETGTRLGEFRDDAFSTRSKRLVNLDEVYAMFPGLSYLNVSSRPEPLCIVLLRGTLPGLEPSVLFEHDAIETVYKQQDPSISIPDPQFKNYLVRKFDTIDVNGEISIAEAQEVFTINCKQMGIEDLTGIEHFTNLITLDCSTNQLSHLPDISGLTSLESLDCRLNQLETLPDLSLLADLKTINCSSNNLTELTDFSPLSGLSYLNCNSNQLSVLEISGLTHLSTLQCQNNLLGSLNVTSLRVLKSLNCSGNLLTNLDVRGLKYLESFTCNNNQLSELSLHGLTLLRTLYCNDNILTTLDVEGLEYMYALSCYRNQLTSVPKVWTLPGALRHFPCQNNLFEEDDCDDINTVKELEGIQFYWNPQADGSTLVCE